ncbi:glucose 1-dehydrogenase [Bradyrhizobium sp. Tv2a-2]|uniref:SDR family NAD(P)-dependent oxidoreductase n=1 Tax=Bradyrhizobium sp. Tv2a-2 TaxID=113395 RepID=UPI00041F15C7|nr:glucose 1-dehydrogenase [Bradyrhizobium sp. Tv2a-2]
MIRLDGKVAVVTGASKGIGAALAKGLAQAGARIIVNYASDKAGAARVVSEIVALGREALLFGADVSQAEQARALVAAAVERYGQLDILVNNAGVFRFEPFEDATESEFHRIYNTNVLGALLTMQEASRHMHRGGTIINIATGGISTLSPGSAIYTSSKAALVTMSRVIAKELGTRGIRVNVVCPGATETEGAHALGVIDGPMVKKLVDNTPLGRLGQPEDMVGPVLFLASKDAHWVTGEVLFASGGSR